MKTPTILRATLLVAAGVFVLKEISPAPAQGTFPPPSGPSVPLMKTLDQIEPRIPLITGSPGVVTSNILYGVQITQSGSYYLTGNLDTTKSRGISIAASDVTLDLMGYTITTSSSSPSSNAIEIEKPVGGSRRNIRVLHGTISGPWGFGIQYNGCENLVFQDLNISDCNSSGIAAGNNPSPLTNNANVSVIRCKIIGPADRSRFTSGGIVLGVTKNALIDQCMVTHAGGSGISMTTLGTNPPSVGSVSNCTVQGCGGRGIIISSGTVRGAAVRGCICEANLGSGFYFQADAVVIKDCSSLGNAKGFEFSTGQGHVCQGCTASGNAGIGFDGLSSGSISDCTSFANNGTGFDFGSGVTAKNCSASYNNGTGFTLRFGCGSISECSSTNNGQPIAANGNITTFSASGFNIYNGVRLVNCTADSNRGTGYLAGAFCSINGCSATRNSVAGFNLTGIEDIRNCYSSQNTTSAYSATGGDIAPVQQGSTATHPGYNTD